MKTDNNANTGLSEISAEPTLKIFNLPLAPIDANTYVKSGIYNQSGWGGAAETSTNIPVNTPFTLIVFGYGNIIGLNFVFQFFLARDTPHVLYVRRGYNGSWLPWRTLQGTS